MDLFNYFRRETTEVNIGAVPLGGPNSIRIQSMTNTSTQDTQACVSCVDVLVIDWIRIELGPPNGTAPIFTSVVSLRK